jgi:hypothetical protein
MEVGLGHLGDVGTLALDRDDAIEALGDLVSAGQGGQCTRTDALGHEVAGLACLCPTLVEVVRVAPSVPVRQWRLAGSS